jgi:hypothetical protein
MDNDEFAKAIEATLQSVKTQCVMLAKSADQIGREGAFIKARIVAPRFSISLLDRMTEIGRRPDSATKEELAQVLGQMIAQFQPQY